MISVVRFQRELFEGFEIFHWQYAHFASKDGFGCCCAVNARCLDGGVSAAFGKVVLIEGHDPDAPSRQRSCRPSRAACGTCLSGYRACSSEKTANYNLHTQNIQGESKVLQSLVVDAATTTIVPQSTLLLAIVIPDRQRTFSAPSTVALGVVWNSSNMVCVSLFPHQRFMIE